MVRNVDKASEMWTISDEHKEIMSAFMTDFWKLIKASYEFPSDISPVHNHYWNTMVKWCDALIRKYDCNSTITRMVMGYLDGQSDRSTKQPVKQMNVDEYINNNK
jgi:hypothetical protein